MKHNSNNEAKKELLTNEILDLEKSKLELESQKLVLEINEHKKGWISKNLTSLISIFLTAFIGIGTISIGFWTGYFDAERTKNENKQFELSEQIKEFEKRKENLIQSNLHISKQLNEIMQQKNTLLHENNLLGEEKSKLSSEAENLKNSVNKLSFDLKHATISAFLKRVYVERKSDFPGFTSLVESINKNKDELNTSRKILLSSIDTSNDLTYKALLYKILYLLNFEDSYRGKIFEMGEKFIDETKVKKVDNRDVAYFWIIFNIAEYKKETEQIKFFNFLYDIAVKLSYNDVNLPFILERCASNSCDFKTGSRVIDLDKYKNICGLISKSKAILLNGYMSERSVQIPFNYNVFNFLGSIAPVCLICSYAEILKGPHNITDNSGLQYLKILLENNNLQLNQGFSPLKYSQLSIYESEYWVQWESEHSELMSIYHNLNDSCNNVNVASKLRGKRFFEN